jgi:hypothetical protein
VARIDPGGARFDAPKPSDCAAAGMSAAARRTLATFRVPTSAAVTKLSSALATVTKCLNSGVVTAVRLTVYIERDSPSGKNRR